MKITLNITVADIQWHEWHDLKDRSQTNHIEGSTIIGVFRITPIPSNPKYFIIDYPRNCRPNTVDATDYSLEEAKERCQSTYRDKILSTMAIEPLKQAMIDLFD